MGCIGHMGEYLGSCLLSHIIPPYLVDSEKKHMNMNMNRLFWRFLLVWHQRMEGYMVLVLYQVIQSRAFERVTFLARYSNWKIDGTVSTYWFSFGPFTNLPFGIGKPSILTLRYIFFSFTFLHQSPNFRSLHTSKKSQHTCQMVRKQIQKPFKWHVDMMIYGIYKHLIYLIFVSWLRNFLWFTWILPTLTLICMQDLCYL